MTLKISGETEDVELEQNEETRIYVFVKQMFVSRIFAASYIGRYYVDSLKAYRDVIRLHSEEKEFVSTLTIVKNRLEVFYRSAIWTSLTEPHEEPTGYCIWTKLENTSLGAYWFMIEDVSFSDIGEVVFKTKVIRNFESPASRNETESTEKVCNNVVKDIKNDFISFLHQTITLHNIKETCKFTFALLMTLATVVLYGIQYLGDYSIKFFREFSNLVKVCTPIILGIIDMISKTIGGFYLLIAMLYRGNAGGNPVAYPMVQAANAPRRGIQYRKQAYPYQEYGPQADYYRYKGNNI